MATLNAWRAAGILAAAMAAATAGAADVSLQTAINNTAGSTLTLDPANRYTGTAFVNKTLRIVGNNAELLPGGGSSLIVTAGTLTLENVRINGGFHAVEVKLGTNAVISGCTITGSAKAFAHEGNGSITVSNTSVSNVAEFAALLGFAGGNTGVSGTFTNLTVNNAPNGISATKGDIEVIGSTLSSIPESHVVGTGTFTLTNSTFNGGNYGLNANKDGSNRPTAIVDGCTFAGNRFGLIMVDPFFSVANSTFTDNEQAIASLGVGGSSGNHLRLENVDVSDASLFGLVMTEGGFLDVAGGNYVRCKTPFELRNGTIATMTGTTIDGTGLSGAGNAVSLRTDCVLTATNCTMIRHLNSIDAQFNSHVTATGNTFIQPDYSFVISKDSTVDARENDLINNGQDGFFVGNFDLTGDTSSGTIIGNYIVNAGTNTGVTPQAGTGIALVATGPFVIEDNIILDSYDTGFNVSQNAAGTFRRNLVYNNRLSGIVISGAGQTFWEDTLVYGHTAADQAGIVFLNGGQPATFDRTAIVGNRFGILQNTTPGHVFRDTLVAQNLSQGISVNAGRILASQTAMLDNADWGVAVNSSERSEFPRSSMKSSNLRGIFTARACNVSDGQKTLATESWWNSAAGGFDVCAGGTQGQRMQYQAAVATSPQSSPAAESMVRVGNSTSIMSAGSGDWIRQTAPGSMGSGALIAAMRRRADFAEAAPSGAVDPRGIVLWTSPGYRELGTVTLEFETVALDAAPAFKLYDREAGVFTTSLACQWNSGSPTKVTVTANPMQLQNGTWYFTNGAPPSSNPATVFANLNATHWQAFTIPGFSAPELSVAGGLRLGIGGATNPSNSFGFWQTRATLDPLAAGRYKLTVTIETSQPIASDKDHPDLRVRVFTSDGLYQRFIASAESGDALLETTLPVFFESAGEPWGVAVDLLGFDPRKSGSFTVKSMALEAIP